MKAGDTVGIYYPKQQNHWLSCWDNRPCHKSACPGNPHGRHGFQTAEKWNHCKGEVFKIYGKGRDIGEKMSSDFAPFFSHITSTRQLG